MYISLCFAWYFTILAFQLPHWPLPKLSLLVLCLLLKLYHVCRVLELSPWSYSLFLIDQIRSVAQSCPTLCDPMYRSTPSLPVHHQLPKFTQTHVHRVGDAIQPSHPLPSPSPLAPNPSQHQSLFQ